MTTTVYGDKSIFPVRMFRSRKWGNSKYARKLNEVKIENTGMMSQSLFSFVNVNF